MEIRYFFNEVKETSLDIKKPILADKEVYNRLLSESKSVIALDITPEGLSVIFDELFRYNFLLHSHVDFEKFLIDVGIDLIELKQQKQALKELEGIESIRRSEAEEFEKREKFLSTIPKYEYKVFKLLDTIFVGRTKAKQLENVLNTYGQYGWKVVSIVENTRDTEGAITGSSFGELIITFERQKY